LGNRRDPTRSGRRPCSANASCACTPRLNRAGVATPHPSPSATPSPSGRGGPRCHV
jgi:hypothetical protein